MLTLLIFFRQVSDIQTCFESSKNKKNASGFDTVPVFFVMSPKEDSRLETKLGGVCGFMI